MISGGCSGESTLFPTSLKWPQFFSWPCMTNSGQHAKSFYFFWQILHFPEFSRSKKADKWADVLQHAYGAKNHSNLVWITNMVLPSCLKKLGSFLGYRETICSVFLPIRTPSLNMVYVWTSFKWPQILQTARHAHGINACQVWTIFNTVCKLRHARPSIVIFLSNSWIFQID